MPYGSFQQNGGRWDSKSVVFSPGRISQDGGERYAKEVENTCVKLSFVEALKKCVA